MASGLTYGVPTNTQDIQERYIQQARGLRDQLPTLKNQAYQGLESQARQKLAGDIQNVNQNTNRRGLLYGGINEGGKQEAAAATAGQLASQAQQSNQNYNNLADTTDNDLMARLLEQYKGKQDEQLNNYNLDLSRNQAANAQRAGVINAITGIAGGVGGGLIARSDENSKKNIKPESGEVNELLESIEPYAYEYKNKSDGDGEFLSPMAQDLEKSEIGKSMVIDTPNGKVVDYGKGFGAIMAIQSALNKRLKNLEAQG